MKSTPLFLALLPSFAFAQVLDDPASYSLGGVWSVEDLGVPANPGGMMFSADGSLLYVVGAAESSDSAVYAVQVTRDPITDQVTDLGPAASTVLVFSGDSSIAGLDAGLALGPDGTLFTSYWDANVLGQRPGGVDGAETLYELDTFGLPSISGITFSPWRTDPNTQQAELHFTTYDEQIFSMALMPEGGGLFLPTGTERLASLPTGGVGGLGYVRQGDEEGHLLLLDYDNGEVLLLRVDPATGLPIDATSGLPTLGTEDPVTERLVSEMGSGPWGLAFDERSVDFFVSTYGGEPSDSIVQFTGPGAVNRAPVADPQSLSTPAGQAVSVQLTGSDPDGDALSFTVTEPPSQGTLDGDAATYTYTPADDFVGDVSLTFVVSDGRLDSAPATVSIAVLAAGDDDDATGDDDDSAGLTGTGCDCSVAERSAPSWGLALLLLGLRRRRG